MTEPSPRISPTHVEIDLKALRFNFYQLKKRVATQAVPSRSADGRLSSTFQERPESPRERVKILSVVKSNAYGHGASRVAPVLQAAGADYFGVGTIDEGIELRKARIRRPILLLLGMVDSDLSSLLRYRLTPVVYDLKTAAALNSFCSKKGKRLPVHVKVDTGMTRLGVLPSDLSSFCDGLRKMKSLEPGGLLTHLADAGDEAFTCLQEKRFQKAREEFKKRFPKARLFHIANSLASIERRCAGFDMVRLGIAQYGVPPLERDERLVSLKPVLRWKTRLVAVKTVGAGVPVSYGRTFSTKGTGRIGILPVGYADGYPRLLSNRSFVLVCGRRAPIVGTICMDMMMIDLSRMPQAKVGESVVLLGRQGQEEICAGEIASLAGTIPYEIFCRISERVRRVYR